LTAATDSRLNGIGNSLLRFWMEMAGTDMRLFKKNIRRLISMAVVGLG
jgi:hypothetical protein